MCCAKRKKQYYQDNKEAIVATAHAKRDTPKRKFTIYKSCAKKRGIEFNLSFEDFMEYWQQPCSYCGDEIKTIGIDRFYNNKGYTKDNILSCCAFCNRAKHACTPQEWTEWIQRLSKKFILEVDSQWFKETLSNLSERSLTRYLQEKGALTQEEE